MSSPPANRQQPNQSGGAAPPSLRRVMVPQQVGLRMRWGAPPSWAQADSESNETAYQPQAGAGSRPSHTLCSQEQKEREGSRSVVHYLRHRSLGVRGCPSVQGMKSQMHRSVVSRLPEQLTERRLGLSTMDRVLASQWLNDSQVVCGTRCNSLLVVDVQTGHIIPIPLMQNRRPRRAHDVPASGIRAIELNPSKTLLATGGKNSNSLAIYQLPSLDPMCLGDRHGHKDAITSIAWVSDTVAVSGSWDGSLAVWRVDPDMLTSSSAEHSGQGVAPYAHIRPRDRKVIRGASIHYGNSKVQALAFSGKRQELGALSLDGHFRLWKACSTLSMLQSFRLPLGQEYMALTYSDEFSLHAVGSQAHLSVLDLRQGHPGFGLWPVCNIVDNIGVYSMSFDQHIITMGTGCGCLLFFDIRAQKFLEERSACTPDSSPEPTGRELRLTCSKGWVNRDDLSMNDLGGIEQLPFAIYTHCYNWPEMKLFVGGGPLSSEFRGNYAGLWS